MASNPRSYSSNSSTSRPVARREPYAAMAGSSSVPETSSQNSPPLVGTCSDMCPAKERQQRERLRDLAVFERLDGNPAKTSQSLAVKKFCRTISSVHVLTDIRPLPVLQKTLKYLLDLADSSNYAFEAVHAFVFDRTRSIRQDLSMQNICNDQAIQMYEDMVKFHIISHQRLSRCSITSESLSLCYLNTEQLIKCLFSLYKMYMINGRSRSIRKNEAEYYSFYVLIHLGGNVPKMGDSLSLWYRQLPIPLLQSKELRFARTLLRYSHLGNYKLFFSSIAAEASKLQLCLLEPCLNEVRARALKYINNSGYQPQPYPLGHLCKVLMIKEMDFESLCSLCGLETSTDEAGLKSLPAKQPGFNVPISGFMSYGLAA